MKYGYSNEYNFCECLHDKFLYQIEPRFVEFLEDVYGRKLDKNSYVICWKSFRTDKADIIVRVEKEKKYISIKSGKNNSVHLESLDSFTSFLKELGCSDEIIEIYIGYHYGIDTSGERIGGKEYQEKYPDKLIQLNDFLNNKVTIKKALDRFLFNGVSEEANSVDAIIYGNSQDFLYATRSKITEYLLEQADIFLSPHFSSLVLQPWTRNLNDNPKYEYRRDFVQVKWYRLDMVFELMKENF